MVASRPRQQKRILGPASEIPDKLYFKIGEVAQLVGVQAHVLRYWEREVSSVRPGKSASNQRRYRRRDVEIFREIRRLLYEERYTLAGAKKRLAGVDKPGEQGPDAVPQHAPAGPTLAEASVAAAAFVMDDVRLRRIRDQILELIDLAED